MAASPSQQTHWLKLRVDLGLERHSGMDPWLELDWGAVSALPALLCDAVVTACTHTAEERGRAGEELCIFLCQRRLCAVAGLLAHNKENAVERPLHELPQKVRDDVFFCISHSPSPQFWPPVPFVIVLSFNLIIPPLLSPCHNPICPLCFYSGSTMGSTPGGGVLAVSLAVRAHVMSSQRWHPTKAGILCPHCTFLQFNSWVHCSKQCFFQLCSC